MPKRWSYQRRVKALRQRIQAAQDEIGRIQAVCSHPAEMVLRAHFLDVDGDSKTQFVCRICEKNWYADGCC